MMKSETSSKTRTNYVRKKAAAMVSIAAAVIAVAAIVTTTMQQQSAQAQTNTEGICSRTEGIHTAIVAAVPNVDSCSNVTDAHLAALTGTLDASSSSIGDLSAGDLDGLTSIEVLNLSNNSISYMPAHIFDPMTELREVNLSNNSLLMLPWNPFHKNLKLQTLDASSNVIAELPEGIFLNNAALISVDFANNRIAYLSGTEFRYSPNIQKINLENNSLPGLNMDTFRGVNHLSELKLAGNPGAPFIFDVQPFNVGENAVEVLIGGGHAPFDVTASISATNGRLSADSVSIPTGIGASAVLTVTHDGDQAATITVSNAAFTDGTRTGVSIANGTPILVAIDGTSQGICSRTREIQNIIIAELGSVHCALVTDSELATITRPFAVVEAGLTNLRAGDIAGLTGVRDLYLYGNQLSELPEDFFKNAGGFDRVLLQDNPGADFELTVNIQTMNNDRVVATIREGTPFHTVVELSATGGTLPDRFTFVGPGATESEPIQTYPSVAGTPVTVKVESVRFQENGLLAYSYYDGFTVKAGQHLTGVTASDTESTAPTGASTQLQPVSTPVPTPEPTTEPVMPLVQEPTEPPAAPTNLTSANGNGSITLSWNAPNDDTITGYEILRRRPTKGENRLTTYVANTQSTSTTYTDTNVTAGVKHAYRVKAINAAGSSGVSNFVLATP